MQIPSKYIPISRIYSLECGKVVYNLKLDAVSNAHFYHIPHAKMVSFADCFFAKHVPSVPTTEYEFGMRQHDLVLELCQKISGRKCSKWQKQ